MEMTILVVVVARSVMETQEEPGRVAVAEGATGEEVILIRSQNAKFGGILLIYFAELNIKGFRKRPIKNP